MGSFGWSNSKHTTLKKCEQMFVFQQSTPWDDSAPKSPAQMFGLSVDEAANAHLSPKIRTGKDAPLDAIIGVALSTFNGYVGETDCGDENPAVWRSRIDDVVRVLWDNSLTKIDPAAVQEKHFIRSQDGWNLFQKPDVETKDGVLVDIKTSEKPWKEGRELVETQPIIYSLNRPETTRFEYHIIVFGDPDRDDCPYFDKRVREVTPDEKKAAKRLIKMSRDRGAWLTENPDAAIPTGHGSWCCNKRWCNFWQECQEKWRHHVPE